MCLVIKGSILVIYAELSYNNLLC